VTTGEVFDLLLAGDLAPAVRAGTPAAITAAAHGDVAPLAQLLARAGDDAGSGPGGDEISSAVNVATTCEDGPFPWTATDPAMRRTQFTMTADALPASTFAPFDAGQVVKLLTQGQVCVSWPSAASATTAPAPALPDVPTLIFSGAEDLRTPTANARAVAAQIPGAHVVVLPHLGHSVLTTDTSGCSAKAVRAFFAGHPVASCAAARQRELPDPAPLAPASVRAASIPTDGHGVAGRTAGAVQITLADLTPEIYTGTFSLTGPSKSPTGYDVGGLRGGWMHLTLDERVVVMHHLSYVPGVTVTGTLGKGRLTIGGAKAAHGVLRQIGTRRVSGVLGGVHVSFELPVRP
jgi:hypothetical protein